MSDRRRTKMTIWETKGYWARAMRRYLPAHVRVAQSSAAWYTQPVDVRDAAVHVLEVPLELGSDACRWIQSAGSRHPAPLVLAIVRPADHAVAWQLRMAGAAAVWDELWQVPVVCRLIERYCNREARADLSLESQIWNNLPWSSLEREVNDVPPDR